MIPGNIIVRQRGTAFHPGANVSLSDSKDGSMSPSLTRWGSLETTPSSPLSLGVSSSPGRLVGPSHPRLAASGPSDHGGSLQMWSQKSLRRDLC